MALPRPKVEVITTSDNKQWLQISRDGKSTSHEVCGNTEKDKIENVVRRVIDDRATWEWLPP